MAQLAIIGHAIRGKEVIEILEMLGGKNEMRFGYRCGCKNPHLAYYIDDTGRVEFINTCNPNENILLYTLEEFLEKFPYKVGDKVKYINNIFRIKSLQWDCEKNTVIYYIDADWSAGYVVETCNLQPYKEETMESKPNLLQQLKEYFDNTPRDVLEKEWNELSYLNEIGPTVDEYLECVKKYRQSNQYPKTYEECCKILGIDTQFCMKYLPHGTLSYKDTLIYNLQALIICRDAYWKIAGNQMGLGKPWEPDWDNEAEEKFCIEVRNDNELCDITYLHAHRILAFPTMKLLDIFAENFKDLIESCKELL